MGPGKRWQKWPPPIERRARPLRGWRWRALSLAASAAGPKRHEPAAWRGRGAADRRRAGDGALVARPGPGPLQSHGAREALAEMAPTDRKKSAPLAGLAMARALSRRFGRWPEAAPSPPPGGSGAPPRRRRSSGSATRPRVRPKAMGPKNCWQKWPPTREETPAVALPPTGRALPMPLRPPAGSGAESAAWRQRTSAAAVAGHGWPGARQDLGGQGCAASPGGLQAGELD